MRKPGILPQVSWNLLPTFPECTRTNVNKMRKVQEAGLTDLENQTEQAEFAPGHLIDVEIAIDSLLLKNKTCRMYYTTKLSPSVFRPVSLRYTTMRGHTPTMLLTTSTRDGIDSSPVKMARRRLDRDIVQSQCSAPFRRVTINFVIEKGSKDPKTEDDTFCKNRFRRRRSKMAYSNSLCEYPHPKYSLYVSASTSEPPKIARRDAELPTADTTDPSTDTSWVASTVKGSTTSTATGRKVPFSDVLMKAHSDSRHSSNSRPTK